MNKGDKLALGILGVVVGLILLTAFIEGYLELPEPNEDLVEKTLWGGVLS